MSEPGRILPPYGGAQRCAAEHCHAQLDEELGAYLYSDTTADKTALAVFCGACAREIDLGPAGVRFTRVAL